jgi:hypothetical protein
MSQALLNVDAPARARRDASEAALTGAARLWFATTLAGQWAFFYYIAAFYGPSTLSGNFKAWSRNDFLLKGYVAGDLVGNLVFGAHVMLAAAVAFGGALQLVPQIRARAPVLHRWNGRIFLACAMAAALGGMEMIWLRGAWQTLDGAFASTLDAALIFGFAVAAWRTARARAFDAHRRWAMRTYLAANGVWFIRVGLFAWIVANGGHIHGFDRFWNFGSYLVPLAMLEIYLRVRRGGGARARWGMAAGLTVASLTTAFGVAAIYIAAWRPLLAKL